MLQVGRQENTLSCVWATAGGRLCDYWGARAGPTHTTSFEPLLHACWAAWCCWLLGCPCGAWCWLLGLATCVPVWGLVLVTWVGYLGARAGSGAGYLGWLLGCQRGGLVLATCPCGAWYLGARAGSGAGYLGWLLARRPGAGYLGWLLGCQRGGLVLATCPCRGLAGYLGWWWLVGLATWVPARGLVLAVGYLRAGLCAVGYLRARAGPGAAGYLGWLLACPCGALCCWLWVGYLGAGAGSGAGYLGWLLTARAGGAGYLSWLFRCPCGAWYWLLGFAAAGCLGWLLGCPCGHHLCCWLLWRPRPGAGYLFGYLLGAWCCWLLGCLVAPCWLLGLVCLGAVGARVLAVSKLDWLFGPGAAGWGGAWCCWLRGLLRLAMGSGDGCGPAEDIRHL